VHRDPSVTKEGPPLPPRATGLFLGVWLAALLFLAFFVVPEVFASCNPPAAP
jgi:hypothetical protein